MELRVYINILVVLLSFISCYIITPLELVFLHLLMFCFWCLVSLRLYLYLRRVRLLQYVGVDTMGRGRMGLAVAFRYTHFITQHLVTQ